jgi:phosphoribosylanthranilate isomerase
MTWVKICGMTNLEDALVAVDAGADAVGFVFYEKSPRCVSVEKAREIVAKLPESVEKVGVFVDKDVNPVDVFLKVRLSVIQAYQTKEGIAGNATGHWTNAVSRGLLPPTAKFVMAYPMSLFDNPVSEIESLWVRPAESRKKARSAVSSARGTFDTLLLDSGNVLQPGGTGKPFDWMQAATISESMRRVDLKLIVAGGLNPNNVGEAIETLHPWGVDVASGVEAAPGKKDPEKVRAFVRAVREMDRKIS